MAEPAKLGDRGGSSARDGKFQRLYKTPTTYLPDGRTFPSLSLSLFSYTHTRMHHAVTCSGPMLVAFLGVSPGKSNELTWTETTVSP